jgi:ribosomal protein S21
MARNINAVIIVHENDLDTALRQLKKALNKDGLFRILKRRKMYPSKGEWRRHKAYRARRFNLVRSREKELVH